MIILSDVDDALAKAKDAWRAAENPVTQLPWESQLARLGVPLESPPEADEAPQEAYRASGKALPRNWDHRALNGRNYVTPIRDQGNCGSCVAFGSLATIETTHARAIDQSPPRIDLSEAHLFFCHAESEGRGCANGWWPSRAYVHVRADGVADEACYPYRVPSDHCAGLCNDASRRVWKISSATKLSTRAQIKDWLATKGPVSACFEVFEDFFHYSSGVYRHVTGALAGGHCVSIIGYDDDQGCWICKNSWGDRWGDGGFFRIRYGECKIETWESHGVSEVIAPNAAG